MMPNLGSEISRLYSSASSRLANGVQNVNSSIRLFGNSCRSHIVRLQNTTNFSSSNILDNDVEQSNNNNSNTNLPVTEQTSTNNASFPVQVPSNQRNSCRSNRRSSRRRDRSHNIYQTYQNGLISIRTLDKDRNVLAAILSIVVIAILATALAQPKWFLIINDLCTSRISATSDLNQRVDDSSKLDTQSAQYRPQSYIHARSSYSIRSIINLMTPSTIYGLTPDYKGCATSQILALNRTIIGLCFLAIMCSLIQFFMDTIGTMQKWVNSIRIHAVGNIISVLLCVLIIGLCYFISILYERFQLHLLFRKIRQMPNEVLIRHNFNKTFSSSSNQFDFQTIHQIEVKFELSYYLVALAGFLSILASAANLFRRPRHIFIERISDFNCRSRIRTNGDENSLLSSEILNNDSAANYVSYYSPNGWMFNPNWSLFYNNSNGGSTPNYNRHTNVNPATVPPVPSCPPPPPYSP